MGRSGALRGIPGRRSETWATGLARAGCACGMTGDEGSADKGREQESDRVTAITMGCSAALLEFALEASFLTKADGLR